MTTEVRMTEPVLLPAVTRIRYNSADAFMTWIEKSNAGDVALVKGDAAGTLSTLPSNSVNMVITSPPYWNQRQYDAGGIGLERSAGDFVRSILEVTAEIQRVLTPDGSFWLNVGDTYHKKSLAGIPWRIALAMMDQQGWIMRNDVVWNKLKGGMDTTKDRLANTHEMLFHFVKQPKYYYDLDPVRAAPGKSKLVHGAVVSPTGVSGVRYRRKIELSTELTVQEKATAIAALDEMLAQIRAGKYSDFRMVIRGAGQRVTHSDQTKVSGRAKELRDKGFYFLRYHPNGAKPSDVWDIVPEDAVKRDALHYAAYPVDLCRIPILATCPPDGVVLDPFVGTGTSLVAARDHGRRSIGIDISTKYLDLCEGRLGA